MIRLIGALMIIAASSAAGAYLSSRLYRRRQSIEGIISALEELKSRICFSDTELEKALMITNRGGAEIIFHEAARNLRRDGTKAAWKNAVLKGAAPLCLTDADVAAVSALSERLGITDSDDQIKNIDGVISSLSRGLKEAETLYEKNGRLYRSCGILCGVLAALLLI